MTSAAKSLVNCESVDKWFPGISGAGWQAPLPPATVIPGYYLWYAIRPTQFRRKVS